MSLNICSACACEIPARLDSCDCDFIDNQSSGFNEELKELVFNTLDFYGQIFQAAKELCIDSGIKYTNDIEDQVIRYADEYKHSV